MVNKCAKPPRLGWLKTQNTTVFSIDILKRRAKKLALRQFHATGTATTRDDAASATRGHARTKTVLALAGPFLGLISSFHNLPLHQYNNFYNNFFALILKTKCARFHD